MFNVAFNIISVKATASNIQVFQQYYAIIALKGSCSRSHSHKHRIESNNTKTLDVRVMCLNPLPHSPKLNDLEREAFRKHCRKKRKCWIQCLVDYERQISLFELHSFCHICKCFQLVQIFKVPVNGT